MVKLWDLRNPTTPVTTNSSSFLKDINQIVPILKQSRILVSCYDGTVKVMNSDLEVVE